MLKTIPVFDPIEGMTILEQKVGAGKNAVNFGKKKKQRDWERILNMWNGILVTAVVGGEKGVLHLWDIQSQVKMFEEAKNGTFNITSIT